MATHLSHSFRFETKATYWSQIVMSQIESGQEAEHKVDCESGESQADHY